VSVVTQPDEKTAIEAERLPPLHSGDRLTAEEYERRYDAMPDLKKAELINGVVYVASPVSFEDHAVPHFNVVTWLGLYSLATPGVRGGDNSTLRLPQANRPQPDACLLILPSHGGQARIDDDHYIVGTPELVAEVAATSANYDLHDKLDVYRRYGVREYVVWRVFDRAVDWFVLREDRYERLPLSSAGYYQSEVLPGLWLDPAALVAGDLARVAQVAQQGLASPDHADFVARLCQAASPS
jgi:Uma2 family endonuclease